MIQNISRRTINDVIPIRAGNGQVVEVGRCEYRAVAEHDLFDAIGIGIRRVPAGDGDLVGRAIEGELKFTWRGAADGDIALQDVRAELQDINTDLS